VESLVTGPRKILITGNMGYVGPAVVDALRRADPEATIIGLDAGFFAPCLTNAATLPECGLDCQYFADVRSIPESVLSGVEAVVHLAAVSNDPIGNAYAELTLEINHRATARLARLARAAGARAFVLASSCSVYGFSEEGPVTEASEARPQTPYAQSKWLAEQSLAQLAGDGFAVTSLRFATACGMSPRLRLDLVLNDFVASAVVAGRIEILSDGTPWRPLIHVRDMARAVEWAIDRRSDEPASFLAVNVGADDFNFRMGDLAEEVRARLPGVAISVGPESAPDRRSYRVDFGLFRELAPASQPQMRIADAVDELREGLEQMGFDDPDFRRSRLARLVMLEDLCRRGLLSERLEWTSRNGSPVAA
jgi:nucleoside-diphosphate-sugar epimerase